jgi:hypothetical protein
MHSNVNDFDVYDPEIDEDYDKPHDNEFYDPLGNEYEAIEYPDSIQNGGQRVIHLLLLLLVLLLIAAVILLGVIPYVEAMTQSIPPLPPPVQA